MILFRLNYGEPGEKEATPLQKMEKQLISIYSEFKQNDSVSREKLYANVLAHYDKIKNDPAKAKDAAFCWKIFDWLGKDADKQSVEASFRGDKFETEKMHYEHMFAVLDNSVVTKANGTKYFFFNEKGVNLMTKTMDDLYDYSKKKLSDDWQTGSFKKNLSVSYGTDEDAAYFREICARLPFLSATIDETGDKKVAKVSLEYDENNIPKTVIAPAPEQYVETEVPKIDAEVKSEEKSTKQGKRSTLTKTSETGGELEEDEEDADIQFVDENRTNGINSASNSRQVTVQSLVDRYLAVNYKHRLPSLDLLESSLNAALRQMASDMGYKGEDAIEQFVYNNLDSFVFSVKNLIASGELKIRSTATVEKVYGGGMSWNEVKAELETNLGKVANDYGEALNNYFNSILGAALTKRMNAGLTTAYNGEEIDVPVVTDLGLVQEIPESIRNKWLEDPSTSSALKYFLKNSYSDERVRENRLNIFSTIYYDALGGNSDAEYAMKKLRKAVDFTVDTEGLVTDVSIKNASWMNQCLSLKSKVLRWADKTTGESSYFDQMLQMGDFGISHANSHGIYPKETYNRALGFSLDKAETLGVKFVDSPSEMILNTEYTVKVKATQNSGVPDGGKMVIKVDLGGVQTELVATDEGNGIYSAKFTPKESGTYSFLAYYVHKDGEFFSGRITTPEMTVAAPQKKPEKKIEPKVDRTPTRYNIPTNLPINAITALNALIPQVGENVIGSSYINDSLKALAGEYGGELNSEGKFLFKNPLNFDQYNALTNGIGSVFSRWIDQKVVDENGILVPVSTILQNKGIDVGALRTQFAGPLTPENLNRAIELIGDKFPSLMDGLTSYKDALSDFQSQVVSAAMMNNLRKRGGNQIELEFSTDLLSKIDARTGEGYKFTGAVYYNFSTDRFSVFQEAPDAAIINNLGLKLAYQLTDKNFLFATEIKGGQVWAKVQDQLIGQTYVQVNANSAVRLSTLVSLGIYGQYGHMFASGSKILKNMVEIKTEKADFIDIGSYVALDGKGVSNTLKDIKVMMGVTSSANLKQNLRGQLLNDNISTFGRIEYKPDWLKGVTIGLEGQMPIKDIKSSGGKLTISYTL